MNYAKINDKLFLVEQPIPSDKPLQEVAKAEPVNRIIIFDRSGSMGWTLRELYADIVKQVELMSDQDTLSLGWFSGLRENGWICKGLSVRDNRDKIASILQQHNYTIGLTCFSEITSSLESVINDLAPISKNFSLLFFTDGCPTVGGNEEAKTTKALKAVADKIGASLFIGYGDYYNKSLMSEMAKSAGGALIHSSNIEEFNKYVAAFTSRTANVKPKKEVVLSENPIDGFAFTLNGKDVNLLEIEDGSKVFIGDESSVFFLTDKKPKTKKAVISVENIDLIEDRTNIAAAIYGASRAYVQMGNIQRALDCLAAAGDKKFIDDINNSYTVAEYGKVEGLLAEAAVNPKYRFVSGRKFNYIPKEDAFCILDLIDILAADTEAKFYPYHKSFSYKRIGKPSKPKDGYPKFVPEENAATSLGDFKWNTSRLNLGVLARINGTVGLGNEAANYGFANTYKTHVYRNYTLVKDGLLNVILLPASISKSTFDVLKSEGVISEDRYIPGNIYSLHLDAIPVINRKIAEGYTSAEKLCLNALEEKRHEAAQKVYKFYLDSFDEKVKHEQTILTAEQEEFLKNKGITKNGFNPPSESEEPTDFYFAKEFEVSVDGFKSLPKVADVEAKLDKGGKLTPSQELMAQYVNKYRTETAGANAKTKVAWLNSQLANVKYELAKIRTDMQRSKFAVILAKKQFNELPKLEEKNSLTFGDVAYTISVKDTRVDL